MLSPGHVESGHSTGWLSAGFPAELQSRVVAKTGTSMSQSWCRRLQPHSADQARSSCQKKAATKAASIAQIYADSPSAGNCRGRERHRQPRRDDDGRGRWSDRTLNGRLGAGTESGQRARKRGRWLPDGVGHRGARSNRRRSRDRRRPNKVDFGVAAWGANSSATREKRCAISS